MLRPHFPYPFPYNRKMSLDMTSIINLPFEISHSSPATYLLEATPHSLQILLRHYKLPTIRICACVKCLNRSEYVLAEAPNFNLFVTRDGAFWSPLPVLSKDDLLTLERTGFGIYSTQPFVGDPGVVIADGLTEMHRVSYFAMFLYTFALYPKNSLSYAERWQGMDGEEAGKIYNYEFRQESSEILDVYLDLKLEKSLFHLNNDVFNKRTVLTFRFLPQFKSYYYWNQRVYGWLYCDYYFAHDNCLLKVNKMLFNQELNVDITNEQLERIKDIDILLTKDKEADNLVLEERRKKAEQLQQKKDDIKRKIKEFKAEKARKEKERLEREEAERKAAEEAYENEEGEQEQEAE